MTTESALRRHHRGRRISGPERLCVAIVLIKQKPATKTDVADFIGCTYETARRLVEALLRTGLVEFAGWADKGQRGFRAALYVWKL